MSGSIAACSGCCAAVDFLRGWRLETGVWRCGRQSELSELLTRSWHNRLPLQPTDSCLQPPPERLCRYLCRPPVSHERLEQLDGDHASLKLKTPWSNGATHVVLTFDELLQRLCALVPRPRTHRVHYHGVLAPAARHRSKVVPSPEQEESESVAPDDATDDAGQSFMFGDLD